MPRRGFCWRWSTFGQLFCKAMQHSTERRNKKNGSVQRHIERHPKAQKIKCAICNQQVGGSNPSTSSTSEWTALHSKSPVERPGFSHTAASFLLFPTKFCAANFRGGPGRARPCPMDCALFKKPGRKTGLFSYRCVIPPLPHEILRCKLSRGPRKQVPPRSLSIFPYSLFTFHSSLNRQSRFFGRE